MNSMDDLETRFEALKETPVPPGLGPEVAAARGRRHRRRLQVQTGLTALAVTTLAVVGALNLPQPALDEPVDPATVAAGGPSRSISWATADQTVGAAGTPRFAADGTLYMLSTAPDVRTYPEDGTPPDFSVWSSGDSGLTWSEAPMAAFGADLWAQDMAVANGGLYVVGTAPATSEAGVADVRLGWSTDGGGSWSPVEIELAATPPQAMGTIAGQSTRTLLASGPENTVLVAQTSFYMNVDEFIPEEFREVDGFGAEVDEDGIVVFDWTASERAAEICRAPEAVPADGSGDTIVMLDDAEKECLAVDSEPIVAWETTWSELGVEPGPLWYSELFVADGQSSFQVVAFPDGLDVSSIEWAGDAFYAVAMEAGAWDSTQVWRSDDGRDWVQVSVLGTNIWVDRVGAVGNTLVAVASDNNGPVLFTSDDRGVTWRTTMLADVAAGLPAESYVSAWDAGDMGIAIHVAPNTDDSTSGHMVTSQDLVTWEVTPQVAVDPSSSYVSQIAVGAEAIFANVQSWSVDVPSSHMVGTIED